MPTFKICAWIALLFGVALTAFSSQVWNYTGGFFGGVWSASGVPLKFQEVTLDRSHRIIRYGQISLLTFVLDALAWSTLFWLALVVFRYFLRGWLLSATWHGWFFLGLLLAPVVLIHIGAGPLYAAFTFWISTPAVEMATWLVKITYGLFVSFNLALLLIELRSRQGIFLWRYPVIVAGILLLGCIADSPILYGFVGQHRKLPLTVDRLVLSPVQEDGSRQLEYHLSQIRLPQENTIYYLQFFLLDHRLDPNRDARISKGGGNYVKQVGGMVYGMVNGTYLKDNQFIEQPVFSGTLQVYPNAHPKYLFIMIEFHGSYPQLGYGTDKGYRRWRLVPLPKEAR